MKCEGLVYRKGQPTWQIYFWQRADKPNTTRSYSFGPSRRSYLVAIEGASVVRGRQLSNREPADGLDRADA
jgi:hypothetical protein